MGLIKCPECGKEVSDRAATCIHCGYPFESTHEKIANEKEIIIMSGLCNRVKSKLFVQNGSAILTNKRFIYLKHSLPKMAVIGAFVNLTSGSYDFDIPTDQFLSIEDGRQGISKTIIINTKDGNKYNFYFTNREQWKIELGNFT